jgi:cytochrome P450
MSLIATAKRGAIGAGLVGFIASARVRAHPYSLYRTLGRLAPVHESLLGAWIVTSHAEASRLLRDPRLGSDEAKVDLSSLRLDNPLLKLVSRGGDDERRVHGEFAKRFHEVMLFRDPPDHTRLRSLVSRAFTPKRVEGLEARVGELVDEILERASKAPQFDLMRELAYPLPARVICELFGVPCEDQDLVVAQAPKLAVGIDPTPLRTAESEHEADQAMEVLVSYLETLIDARRRSPGDDLLSALIAVEEQGEQLSTDELISNVVLLLIAGHETTANLLGNGLVALLAHPRELAKLQDDPALDRSAVEELLRFDSPVQMCERITLDHVEVGGQVVPPGRLMVLLIGAANRDRSVFDQPDQLDLGRDPNPHLAFGAGAHFCLGAALARLEGRIVLGTLVRRYPNLRLVPHGARRRNSFTVRGYTRLEVTLQ